MIERRVRDFRLDSRLRKYCQQDILSLCGMLDSLGGDETDVNICLQVRGAEEGWGSGFEAWVNVELISLQQERLKGGSTASRTLCRCVACWTPLGG